MKRNKLLLISVLACVAITVAMLVLTRSKKSEVHFAHDAAFDPYISAYTAGEIHRTSGVQVRFARNMVPFDAVGKALPENPFHFEPKISGTVQWKNPRTLEFVPEKALPSGKSFLAALEMKHIDDSIPGVPSSFPFEFKTIPQGVKVEILGAQTIDMKKFAWQRLQGEVQTRDFEPDENIEKIFSARLKSKKLPISWRHSPEERLHTFTIDSIPKGMKSGELLLAWDGDKLDLPISGKEIIPIAELGVFRHVKTRVVSRPQTHIVLEFSEPLATNQNLQGLVRLNGSNVKYSIDGNQVKLYPSAQTSGMVNVEVFKGIMNLTGERLDEGFSLPLAIESPKPEVKLIGQGVIIPKSETLPFIFETIGLNAVDVSVVKIFENNIPQFLQVNQLDDDYEMFRVGKEVVKKKILLDAGSVEPNAWVKHSLDLSSLVDPDPGAIYEISLGFRPSYTLYPCDTSENELKDWDMLKRRSDYGDAMEDEEESNEDGYWYSYSWDQRDNPCNAAYYANDRIVRRSVLSSDLGLIFKKGPESALCIVTNIKTTQPVEGVELEIYDFQNQLITRTVTGKDGQAKPQIARKPYLLIAKQGKQRGYLRIDDGSSLSVSRFDVDGLTPHKGLKGFIYGERGVWRPGDEMYLTFMLEDKDKTLPAGHPVQFELIDPLGKVVVTQTKKEGVNNFYSFQPQLSEDAPTGNYMAKVKVGGANFQKYLKVETILPNRLKINLSAGGKELSSVSQGQSLDLNAAWLHGAVAQQLNAEVLVSLYKTETSFKNYRDFVFDDPVRYFESEEITLFEGQLDANGKAQVPLYLNTNTRAPGMLKANFRTRVFEPGGGFSTDMLSAAYSPYEYYAGIRKPSLDKWEPILDISKTHPIEILTLNEAGSPVSRKDLDLKLYKLDWRWWWDNSYNDISNYEGTMYTDPVQSAKLSTVNGKATWNLKVNEGDWGRYLLRVADEAGHITGMIVYVDYLGWYSRSKQGKNEGAKMLNFTADKEKYKVGENVTLNIPTGYEGRALVSIESGSKVLETHWIDAKKGMTSFSFKTTTAMVPNIYAYVTLLQPHAQTKNDLPIRMYGVLGMEVEDPGTILTPTIAMKETLAPNEKFEVKVGEASGKQMTYTLAVVDEGLLSLTRFKTPSPHEAFYRREALRVKTWDIYDMVVGAYGGEIKSLLSIGGDGEGLSPDGAKQNRFKPVVMYLGPFTLPAGQTQTHTLEMPNYVGEIRTMVVAGNSNAYGFAEKATPVKKPLMVLGTLPRVLGPGETLRLPVTVFAMEDRIKNAQVNVTVSGLLELEGSASQSLTFATTGDKVAGFNLKVKPQTGMGKVTIVATSGNDVARYETEIEVRNPNLPVTNVASTVLQAGKNWEQSFQGPGMEGTNSGYMEVSSIPSMNLSARLPYLIQYPYGCIEQTVSSAFPQVHLISLMDLNDKQKKDIENNVKAAVKRLSNFQKADGSFTYWPGNGDYSEWGTNYAGHFLLEARVAGYSIPDGMLDKWAAFQKKAAGDWRNNAFTPALKQAAQLTQGYRLYLLALANQAEMGAMNRMRQEKDLYVAAKAHLASAYYQAGQQKAGQNLMENLPTTIPDYTELSYTYGSAERDRAIILESLSLMNDRKRAEPLVQAISSKLSADTWMSTQSIAYGLISIAKYVGKGTKSNWQFSYRIDGGAWQKVSTSSSVWQMNLANAGSGKVEFKNESSQVLYPRLVTRGVPAQGDNTSASRGLKMDVKFTDLQGVNLDVSKVAQGKEFYAIVQLTNTGTRGTYREMALSQVFPSGWEIYNGRLYDVSDSTTQISVPTYRDIRDDRVYTFYDIKPGETKTFKVRLSASYIGRYYLPSTTSEAMYDNTINARVPGRWVEVIPQTQG